MGADGNAKRYDNEEAHAAGEHAERYTRTKNSVKESTT